MSESLEEAKARVERENFVPHEEPVCDGGCGRVNAPHRHGLPCYAACNDCRGICHPICPANERTKNDG